MTTKRRIFVALVTFERLNGGAKHLPDEAQGACGYIALDARDEDEIFDILHAGLAYEGLRLVDVDEIRQVDRGDLGAIPDEHLRANVRNWEEGKRWVWGTIHIYLADGEA